MDYRNYIKVVFKDVALDGQRISKDSTILLGSFLDAIFDSIIEDIFKIVTTINQKTILIKFIEVAFKNSLIPELFEPANEFAIKAIQTYINSLNTAEKIEGEKRKPVSRSKKAGIIWPIGKTETMIRKIFNFRRIDHSVPVYFAAIFEFIVRDILTSCSKLVKENGKQVTILQRHVSHVILSDEKYIELYDNLNIITHYKIAVVNTDEIPTEPDKKKLFKKRVNRLTEAQVNQNTYCQHAPFEKIFRLLIERNNSSVNVSSHNIKKIQIFIERLTIKIIEQALQIIVSEGKRQVNKDSLILAKKILRFKLFNKDYSDDELKFSNPQLKRMCYASGATTVASNIYEEISQLICAIADKFICHAITFIEMKDMKTIKDLAIKFAISQLGYRFVHDIEQKKKTKKKIEPED